MPIRRVQLEALHLTLRTPLVTAAGEHTSRDGWIVRMETDVAVSLGEATPLPSFGTESLAQCEQSLRDAARTLEGTALPERLDQVTALVDDCVSDHRPAARHAIELALLEQIAKARTVSLARLLSPRVHSSVAIGALLVSRKPDVLADEAAAAVEQGFGTLKIKVGSRFLGEDVDRVCAVRERVGERIAIRIDANGAWTREQAISALEALTEWMPELCEQPVAAGDIEGLRQVRDAVAVRIAADETLAQPESRRAVLEPDPAVDSLVLKPMVLGGLLPALELARRADALDVTSFVTHSLDGPVARAAAVHLALALPGRDLASGLAGDLFVDPDPLSGWIRRGRIALPSAVLVLGT